MAKVRKAQKAPKKPKILAVRRPHGIMRRKGSDDITTPDFQLAPDAIPGIAQVIVNLWTNQNLRNAVMARTMPDRQRDGHGSCCHTSHNGNQCGGTDLQFYAVRNNQ